MSMPHLPIAAAPVLAVLAGCAVSRTPLPMADTADPIASVRYAVVGGVPSRCAVDDRMPVHRPSSLAAIPNARPTLGALTMPNACAAAQRVLVSYPSPPAHP